eukprot:Pgem_evm1s15689
MILLSLSLFFLFINIYPLIFVEDQFGTNKEDVVVQKIVEEGEIKAMAFKGVSLYTRGNQ